MGKDDAAVAALGEAAAVVDAELVRVGYEALKRRCRGDLALLEAVELLHQLATRAAGDAS